MTCLLTRFSSMIDDGPHVNKQEICTKVVQYPGLREHSLLGRSTQPLVCSFKIALEMPLQHKHAFQMVSK